MVAILAGRDTAVFTIVNVLFEGSHLAHARHARRGPFNSTCDNHFPSFIFAYRHFTT